MAKDPGTWHDSDPSTTVNWPVTVSAWAAATEPILERVGSAYGGSITYQRLAEQLFEQTGYRTRMLLGNWIGQVLGPVQTATLVEGKPPLSSLVVRAETGGVGDGYVNHQNPQGFATFAERQQAAAVDRLTCYRVYMRPCTPKCRTPDDRAVRRQKHPEGPSRTSAAEDLPQPLHRAPGQRPLRLLRLTGPRDGLVRAVALRRLSDPRAGERRRVKVTTTGSHSVRTKHYGRGHGASQVTRIEDEARLYDEVGRLARALGGSRHLAGSSAGDGWPTLGLYMFLEEGEIRRDGSPRITRIGTHALRQQSKTMLWGRLAQHRGRVGGRNPGGGNHRGSVFRLHVGTAIIDRDALPSGLKQSWLSTRRDPAWAQGEDDLERAVSLHIGRMPIVWLAIPTNRDGTNDRGYIERNAIGLLSVLSGGCEHPSMDWLGLRASNPKIAASGLWNVNHVDEGYDPMFLDHLSRLIDQMPAAR